VPERVWTEIAAAMAAAEPGRFVEILRDCGALAVLLPEVDRLFGVPQPAEYHPEVDTGAHVLMAMNQAAGNGASPQAVFALLLHDLGKGLTPQAEWPQHRGHETSGLPLVEAVCARLRAPGGWSELASIVCRLHLRAHRLSEMRPAGVMRLIEDAGLLRKPALLGDFLAACEADYRGRQGRQARDLDMAGLEGEQIGAKLREARITAIAGSADPAG